MVEQPRFNICKLEDSRLANADVEDLPSRIKENILDALQYSCVYWSNHLCHISGNGDERVWRSLREFFEGPYGERNGDGPNWCPKPLESEIICGQSKHTSMISSVN